MTFRPTTGAIWGVSFPIIVAGLGETIVDITDVIFLGHYGVTELAAVALADAIYDVGLVAIAGLVDGMQVMMARRAGQGQPREIGRAFNQGLYLLAVAAIAMFVLLQTAAPAVTAALVTSDDVRRGVDDYLRIAAFAVFFDAFSMAWSAFYVGVSRTRVLIAATVVLAVTNIVLDALLVFGSWGFPEMGIEGAAVASLCAEIAAAALLTGYALARGYVRRFGLLALGRWNRALARRLLVISTPVSLEALVEAGRWLLFFLIIENLGETALASANVVYTCYVVLLIPLEGFSESTCSMVSNLIGQGRAPGMRHLLGRTTALSYLLTLPLAAFAAAFPQTVLSLFTDDATTIETSTASLMVVAAAILVTIPGEMLLSALVGTGDTRGALRIELIHTLLLLTYTYVAALVLGLPLACIWASIVLGWIVRIGLCWARLRRQAWRQVAV